MGIQKPDWDLREITKETAYSFTRKRHDFWSPQCDFLLLANAETDGPVVAFFQYVEAYGVVDQDYFDRFADMLPGPDTSAVWDSFHCIFDSTPSFFEDRKWQFIETGINHKRREELLDDAIANGGFFYSWRWL